MSNQIAENTAKELETVEVEALIEQYESLQRLKNNEDFKKVILEGYLEKKVLESVSLLAVPAIKQRGQRPDVMEDLVSISNLKYYLQMIEQLGSVAKEDLNDAMFEEVEE